MRYAALAIALLAGGCLHRYSEPPPRPVEFAQTNPTVAPEPCEKAAEIVVPPGQTPPPEAEGELGVVDVRGDDRFAMRGYVAFTWSSDGERIVSATQEGVLFWSASTGVLERRIDLGTRLERVHKVVMSPDDQWLAVVGFEPRKETSALDVPSMWLVRANGEGVKKFDGIGDGISFTPDNKKLVAHGHTWDLAAGTHTKTSVPAIKHEAKFLPGNERAVVFINQDKPGKQASIPEVWDVASGRVLHRFPEVQTSISASISGDGKRFALLQKGELSVYSLDTFERVVHIPSVGDAQMVHLSHDGRKAVLEVLMCVTLLSSASNKNWKCPSPDLSVWDLDRAERSWHKPNGSGDGWIFTRDGEYLTGPDTRLVDYIIRVRDGAELRFGTRIRSLSPGNHRVIFDGKHGLEIGSLDGKSVVPAFQRAPKVVARSADGRYWVTLGNEGRLRIESDSSCVRLGIAHGSWPEPRNRYDFFNPQDHTVVFSPDGTSLFTVLAATSMHALFRAYDTKDGSERWSIRAGGQGGGIASVLPTSGQVLFQGYNHPELRRFNAVTGTELPKGKVPRLAYYTPPGGGATYEVRSHEGDRAGYVTRPVSDRNGVRIAASSFIGNKCHLSIWDLRNPRGVEDRSPGCLSAIKALSPDEKWLAAAGTDGRIRIMSWTEDRTHFVAEPFSGKVTALVFAPAGDRFASADEHGHVLLADPKDGNVKGRARLPLDHAEHLWISPDGRMLVADTARGQRVRFRIGK